MLDALSFGARVRRLAASLAVAAMAWLVATSAYATVMVEIPLEDMIRDADVIVHATVGRTGGVLVEHEGRLEPHTVSELRVADVLKGDVGDVVVVDEIGGTVSPEDGQGFASWIDGTPRYRAGDEVVVFLRRVPGTTDRYRTVGMEQGRFVVVHGIPSIGGAPATPTTVSRDLSALAFASWTDGQMTIHDGGPTPTVPYDDFVGFVRSVLEQLEHTPAVPADPTIDPRPAAPALPPTGGAR